MVEPGALSDEQLKLLIQKVLSGEYTRRGRVSVQEMASLCFAMKSGAINPQGAEVQRVGAILGELGWVKCRRGSVDRIWSWVMYMPDLAEWEVMLVRYFNSTGATKVTVFGLVVDCFRFDPDEVNPQGWQCQAVGDLMKKLGWIKFRTSGADGTPRKWMYKCP